MPAYLKNFPTVRWLIRILIHPGWAPLGVVGLHLTLASFGLTQRFDALLHFLGGAAIGYFLDATACLYSKHIAAIPQAVRYMLAFASACVIALFWEFAEFASDRFLGTRVQEGLSETMGDLMFGVLGAASALVIAAMIRMKKSN